MALFISLCIYYWNISKMIKKNYIPTEHTNLLSIVCLNEDIIDMYSIFAINIVLYEYITNQNLNIILITICIWLLLCFNDGHIALTIITCANIMKYMTMYSTHYLVMTMYIIIHSTWIIFLLISKKIIVLEIIFLLLFSIQYLFDNIKYIKTYMYL